MTTRTAKKTAHQIDNDTRTVWVNGPQGECLARFGAMGVDVHRSMQDQLEDKSECLCCTHAPTDLNDWRLFQRETLRHHAIVVGDEHMPRRLNITHTTQPRSTKTAK